MTLILVHYSSLIRNLGVFSRYYALHKGVIGAGASWKKVNRPIFAFHVAYQRQSRLREFFGGQIGLTLVRFAGRLGKWMREEF